MRSIAHNTAAAAALYLLPSYVYSDTALDWIARIARNNAIGVLTRAPAGAVQHLYTFHNNGESCHWHLPRWPFDGCAQIPRIDFGPARLHIVPFDALAHPEMAVASAKQGCDLLLASEDRLSPEHRLLAGVRTIDNICLAVCALNDAGIWITPEGHNRWEELSAGPGEVCQYSLDTHYTREKKYQDRVDFEVLLRSGFKTSP